MKMSRLCLSIALLILLVTLVSCTPGGKNSKHTQVTPKPIFHLKTQNKGLGLTPLILYYCNKNTWECKAFAYSGLCTKGTMLYFPTKEKCMKFCRSPAGTRREPGNSTLLIV